MKNWFPARKFFFPSYVNLNFLFLSCQKRIRLAIYRIFLVISFACFNFGFWLHVLLNIGKILQQKTIENAKNHCITLHKCIKQTQVTAYAFGSRSHFFLLKCSRTECLCRRLKRLWMQFFAWHVSLHLSVSQIVHKCYFKLNFLYKIPFV